VTDILSVFNTSGDESSRAFEIISHIEFSRRYRARWLVHINVANGRKDGTVMPTDEEGGCLVPNVGRTLASQACAFMDFGFVASWQLESVRL